MKNESENNNIKNTCSNYEGSRTLLLFLNLCRNVPRGKLKRICSYLLHNFLD